MMEVLEYVPTDDCIRTDLTGVMLNLWRCWKKTEPLHNQRNQYFRRWNLKTGVMSFNETGCTVPEGLKMATLSLLSLEQAENFASLDSNLCRHPNVNSLVKVKSSQFSYIKDLVIKTVRKILVSDSRRQPRRWKSKPRRTKNRKRHPDKL